MKVTSIETIRMGEFPNLLWVRVYTDEGLGETFYGPDSAEGRITVPEGPGLSLALDPERLEAPDVARRVSG